MAKVSTPGPLSLGATLGALRLRRRARKALQPGLVSSPLPRWPPASVHATPALHS